MIHLQRSAFTDAVIELAQTSGPVGDSEAPKSGVGWLGQPNVGDFIAYSVITPMTANAGSGPLDDTQADINVPYAITSYGVTRRQCETQADRVRRVVRTLAKQRVTMWAGEAEESTRKVQQVLVAQYGPIQRTGQTDPAVFAETDLITIWTTP